MKKVMMVLMFCALAVLGFADGLTNQQKWEATVAQFKTDENLSAQQKNYVIDDAEQFLKDPQNASLNVLPALLLAYYVTQTADAENYVATLEGLVPAGQEEASLNTIAERVEWFKEDNEDKLPKMSLGRLQVSIRAQFRRMEKAMADRFGPQRDPRLMEQQAGKPLPNAGPKKRRRGPSEYKKSSPAPACVAPGAGCGE